MSESVLQLLGPSFTASDVPVYRHKNHMAQYIAGLAFCSTSTGLSKKKSKPKARSSEKKNALINHLPEEAGCVCTQIFKRPQI